MFLFFTVIKYTWYKCPILAVFRHTVGPLSPSIPYAASATVHSTLISALLDTILLPYRMALALLESPKSDVTWDLSLGGTGWFWLFAKSPCGRNSTSSVHQFMYVPWCSPFDCVNQVAVNPWCVDPCENLGFHALRPRPVVKVSLL